MRLLYQPDGKAMPAPISTRDAILDAAQQIAANKGAGHVTLDAVAKESGLSKGGVLYHFPNKDSLINSMLQRLIQQNRAVQALHEAELSSQAHNTTRALMRTQLTFCKDLPTEVALAVLTASAEKPELLIPLREYMDELFQRIKAEGGDTDLKLLLWAAADGLLFQNMLDISPLEKSERARLNQRLLSLAEELLS
ncbi:MAG: TetR/AcrR family transcriptional regulator [Moraxellaceae bacterium]|nr:TetR/AcrR family transcriptional regulator [Moraxellaceae bacterium]MDP1776929.1 TetR/AcrR family transcriptional regulator [Moraxellaceae bacterium]MDZ4297242.1 TetR/AcrR family transcriptional regulator [Moraxellaceae bacterium]MDZ4386222.1 TetR/AcrR family transcriptional regulator [Moraxellaceae bacterium]